jgi:hypothetical protein
MSPFGIFTIVLISLYAIYYAVLITRDIYGKKDAVKSEEEEFDVSSLQEEDMAVGVKETENGFSLVPSYKNDETAKTVSPVSPGNVSQESEVAHPSGAPIAAIPVEPTSSCEGSMSATQKKVEKVQEEMDEIATMGNLTMSKEFFRDLLLQANKEGSLFVRKKHVPAV